MYKPFYLASIIGVLSIFSTSLKAQEDINLDSIVVTANRLPMSVNETGRNISIITSSDIQSLPYTSLDELLQYIPGIEVQSRNAFGAQGDITMRGSTFTQVLVLVDGMRLNDPLTAHFNSSIPVSLSEIERIEVLRGAAAAIYGADAVGGVINVITKAFSPQKAEDYQNISGSLSYGENKLIQAQQGFAWQKNRFFIGGGFNMNQSDGELVSARRLGDDSELEEYANFFDIKTMGLSFAYFLPNDWAIRARSSYDYRDFSARYFYTTSPFDKSTEITRTWWNQVQVSKMGDKSQWNMNAAYKLNTDEFIFSPDFPSTNAHETQLLNFTLQNTLNISPNFTLSHGLQLDHRKIESNDRGNHQDAHVGIYSLGVFQFQERLNLSLSARLDYDENYDWEFSPQLNVSYVLPKVVLRASVGRSIRAADYTERYVSNNLSNLTSGRNLGNPDLNAERSWSEEFGLDYTVLPSLVLKATAFFRQSSSLVDFVNTPVENIPAGIGDLQSEASYFFAQNITEVQSNGFELESWFQPRIGEKARLKVGLGYTFLKTSNEEDIISVYISSHARHLLTFQAQLHYPRWNLALSSLYKSRDPRVASAIESNLSGEYSLWNMRFEYKLPQNLGLQLQIHNLWDKEYQDILGAPMPGRWIRAGLNFNF